MWSDSSSDSASDPTSGPSSDPSFDLSFNSEIENQPQLSSEKIPTRRTLLANFIASLMSFASGTVVGEWTDPQHPKSLVVFIHLIGASLGALMAGQLSRTKGRKEFLLLVSIPMAVGWMLIMVFIDYFYLILAGRFLCGLSVGSVTVAVRLYNYDVSPNVYRDRCTVFLDFMLCAGILYSYVCSSLISLRLFASTCAVIPLVFYAIFRHMPESPWYLYSQTRYTDVNMALVWLRGDDYDVSMAFDEYAKLENKKHAHSFYKESYPEGIKYGRKRDFVKSIGLSLALATMQRMSGAGAIIQYTAKLFEVSKSSVAPSTASIITGVFQLIGSGIAIFLIDRVGRRILIYISSSVVVTCLAMLSLYFCFLNIGMLANSLKILPIIIVCTFVSFFRLGLGPLPWFINTELIGTDHSNCVYYCIVSYSWILSFVVIKTFVVLIDEWPVTLWMLYTIISVFGFLFTLFFVPETKNKSVDEIRLSLAKTYQINLS